MHSTPPPFNFVFLSSAGLSSVSEKKELKVHTIYDV